MIDWKARRRASILEKRRIDNLKRKKEEADSEKKYKDEEADSETKKYKVLEEEETAMKAEMIAMKNLDLSNLPPRGKTEEAESPPSQSHPRLHLKIVDPEIKEAESLPSESDILPGPSESYKLYFFFRHVFSPVRYSLYEVDVSIPLPPPPPPSKAVQDDKIRNPRPLSPILQLKTGKYADDMCCIQLGSMLYFLGGEMKIKNPYIDKDVKKELAVWDLFPKDIYCFELANDHNYRELKAGTAMNSGKASPLAFVADEKIYVIGSSRWDSDENFAYFEMFDPKVDNWIILPNPPIRNVNTIWVGHVVVGRKALITALQPHETERLYCFDLDTHKWANTSIPDYLGNFSGDTQFVGRRLYGFHYEKVAALVPLEEEEEEKEVGVEEEEAEDKELQQFFKHHRLHQVSEEMGMDAICNVPPQVQYSASLLHLGKMYFCYVRTGMPPHPDPNFGNGFATGNDKKRFISIVIFQAVRETYKKNGTRFSKANFLHSEHFEVNTPFPNRGFIKGCYVLGSEENKILDKMHRQKVAEVEKLTQTVRELEEAVLAGGIAANAVRDYQRKVQEMNEERKTLEREVARVKVTANRVATVVANEWKDANDKVMPVKQWLEERKIFQTLYQSPKQMKASVSFVTPRVNSISTQSGMKRQSLSYAKFALCSLGKKVSHT